MTGGKFSGAGSNAGLQYQWAKYEADKFCILTSYVVRNFKRAQAGSKSVAMARLKITIADCRAALDNDIMSPTFLSMSSVSDALEYPASDGEGDGASSDDEGNILSAIPYPEGADAPPIADGDAEPQSGNEKQPEEEDANTFRTLRSFDAYAETEPCDLEEQNTMIVVSSDSEDDDARALRALE